MSIEDLYLYPIEDNDWESSYSALLKDPFIQKKYNRNKRIRDKIEYIDILSYEVKKPGFVIDLGPGPGEFLELCRYYGNKIEGIDSSLSENLMGFEYLELSRLMVKRQKIPVRYVGFENLLSSTLPWNDNEISFINSQGSIEQIFSKHIKGNMESKDYRGVYWTLDNSMSIDFDKLFSEAKRVLKEGGIFLIVGNSTGNTDEYFVFIKEKATKFGFELMGVPEPYAQYKNRVHKMKKIK